MLCDKKEKERRKGKQKKNESNDFQEGIKKKRENVCECFIYREKRRIWVGRSFFCMKYNYFFFWFMCIKEMGWNKESKCYI